jgi:hypothetical protein
LKSCCETTLHATFAACRVLTHIQQANGNCPLSIRRYVRRVFPDGIFWVEIGKTPLIASRMGDIGVAVGESRDDFPDESRGKSRLAEILADKSALLILDDVWDHRHVEAFQVTGNRCRIVVTTRLGIIAVCLGIASQTVNTLTEDEGMALFAGRLQAPINDDMALHYPVARRAYARCEHRSGNPGKTL